MGSLPNYADNIERVARQARLLKGIGHVSIALDTFHSGNEIYYSQLNQQALHYYGVVWLLVVLASILVAIHWVQVVKVLVTCYIMFLKMIDFIITFIYSDNFLIFIILSWFAISILSIIDSIWIAWYRNLKQMDMIFEGYSLDYGIYINIQRAGTYGLAMLFPNTLGKRLYKHVDYTSLEIDKKTKWLYMFCPLSFFISIVFMIIGLLIGEARGLL